MTPPTSDTLPLLRRWVGAPWALLLRLTRRWRSIAMRLLTGADTTLVACTASSQ